MSNYKGHLVGGAVTFVGSYFALTLLQVQVPINPLQLLLFCLFGSLFPDIDTKSKVQILSYRMAFIAFITLALLQKWSAVILMSFLLLIPLVVHHRTLSHKKWFIVAIPTALYTAALIYQPQYAVSILWNGVFFVAGAFSHLVLDYGFRVAFKYR